MSGDLRAELSLRRDEWSLDVHLDVPAGSTLAVLGPNGAGKSTIVEAVAGITPITSGRIVFGERVLDDPAAGVFVSPEDRGIGVVFQDLALFPHLSALENVAFGPRARGVERLEAEATAAAWLERMGVAARAEARPGELSGGEAQRVALARALITGPDLLLLDEPLAAVDVSGRSTLRRLLADHLASFRGPRVIVTHDPSEAALLADEILIVEHGHVTQRGTASDIRLRPGSPYAADLAGANLVVGEAAGHLVQVGEHRLTVADDLAAGPVALTVHPRAIAVHLEAPQGSPRNTWPTDIVRVEHHGDRIRLDVGAPLPLTVEVTPGAMEALGIQVGSPVWVSIKATEIGVARI